MRRKFLIVLCLCMLLSLCSCSKKQNNEPDIDEETGRKIVTIAAISPVYPSGELKVAVNKFNKDNTEYKVIINEYADVTYGTWYENGFDPAVTDNALIQFNTDIMAGNIPDIMLYETKAPLVSYAQKGLLADIYEFMNNDPDFHKDDYLPNAFAVAEKDGKLYEIFPSFIFYAMYAKTSEVGTSSTWTSDEFYDYISTKPTAEYIAGTLTKSEFIVQSVQQLFKGYGTNLYNFDSDEFIKLLKIAERFPIEKPYEKAGFDQSEFNLNVQYGDPIMLWMNVQNFHTV